MYINIYTMIVKIVGEIKLKLNQKETNSHRIFFKDFLSHCMVIVLTLIKVLYYFYQTQIKK